MSANPYSIQIPKSSPTLRPLSMGGKNPAGAEIAVNQCFITYNQQPWLPVMGEFHFSRFPAENWRSELRKMKAGGINVIATYIFWIHIEEIEGQFDWSGDRNLRQFITLCAELGLYAYPRIGPWAHGECRNGGFPDWLVEKCGTALRTDDAQYLTYVRRFYAQIAAQLQGTLWKDGGPVIGLQVENELLDNAAHIRTLKQMAVAAGLEVPLYTMTGWGPAEVPAGEVIPVFGGYPDAFWERQVEGWSRSSRKHYFFSSLRDDNSIGADLNKRPELGSLDYLNQYPFGTCETGGGMQVAYHRRPFIQPDDIASLALVKIGNGSNLQGYYMYHGGANPLGSSTTLQESQATHYPNDLPVINYDFQAPLGQYGQVRNSYHTLRPLHLFLQDFGDRLAPLPSILPRQMPAHVDDRDTLRWAVRSDGQRAFLFINNYQRVEGLPAHENVQFKVIFPTGSLTLPSRPLTIPAQSYSIWPINLDLGGIQLKYASAQLICQVTVADVPCYVFSAQDGIDSEFAILAADVADIRTPGQAAVGELDLLLTQLTPGPGCLTTLQKPDGKSVQILLLRASDAHRLWKVNLAGQERLFLCEDSLQFDQDQIWLQTRQQGSRSFSAFPSFHSLSADSAKVQYAGPDGIFSQYCVEIPTDEPSCVAQRIQPAGTVRSVPIGPFAVAQAPDDADFDQAEAWRITFPKNILDNAQDVFLRISYQADAARAYIGNSLIDDDFYNGRIWEIGLRRFAPEVISEGITLSILPLRKDAPIYLPPEQQPAFDPNGIALKVEAIHVQSLAEVHLRVS